MSPTPRAQAPPSARGVDSIAAASKASLRGNRHRSGAGVVASDSRSVTCGSSPRRARIRDTIGGRMLRLTESAGRKLSEVLAQQAEHGKSWYGLRLRVEAGCCSGPRYGLSLTEREA